MPAFRGVCWGGTLVTSGVFLLDAEVKSVLCWLGSKALVVVTYLLLRFEEFKLETDEGKAMVFAEAAFL